MATKGNSGSPDTFLDTDGNPAERRAVLSAFVANVTLNWVALFMVAASSVRVAIYRSSSATVTGGATLVADLGVITRGGSNGLESIEIPGDPGISAGEYAIVCVRYDPSVVGLVAVKNLFEAFPPTGSPDGDVIRSRRAFPDVPISTAFPGTSAADDAAEQEARVLRVTLDYSESDGAPSLTAGPTPSNVSSSGFDIGGTSDESGTATLFVTAAGASQPSDGAFDASTETASITAGVPFSIHHTS